MANEGTWLEVNFKLDGFSRIDFSRVKVRRAMSQIGRMVQKSAKKLVSKRGLSKSDDYPGKQTGRLARAIRFRVSKPGFLVRVAPLKTSDMKDFYPAFLNYGIKGDAKIGRLAAGQGVGKSNRRRRGERAALVGARTSSTNFKLKPRKNYMTDALDQNETKVRLILRHTLENALIPRK